MFTSLLDHKWILTYVFKEQLQSNESLNSMKASGRMQSKKNFI